MKGLAGGGIYNAACIKGSERMRAHRGGLLGRFTLLEKSGSVGRVEGRYVFLPCATRTSGRQLRVEMSIQ